MSNTKRYKLRKWYPSLPKDWKDRVGNVYVEQHPSSLTFSRNGDCLRPILNVSEVKNNPEFWEEVEEKDYEILSFKDVRDNDQELVMLRADGKYRFPDDNVHDGVTEQQMLHEGACVDSGDFVIYSVQRKYDGEVFTVGDYTNFEEIVGFKIIDNKMKVEFRIMEEYKSTSWGTQSLRNVIKKNTEPLFTTEDGVDIYEGNEYYLVLYWNIMRRVASGKYIPSNKLVFGSRKRAEEYVEENKPRYSKADIKRVASKLDDHYEKVNSTIGDLLLREFLLD